MPTNFLGTGWKFPLELDQNGSIATASGEASIRQSIWQILSTARGERVMHPDFGCGIHDLVFAPNTVGTAGQIIHEVQEALVRWEPRIDVLDVDTIPDEDEPNLLRIAIAYQVRTTNSRFNLVYPFYLES